MRNYFLKPKLECFSMVWSPAMKPGQGPPSLKLFSLVVSCTARPLVRLVKVCMLLVS